MACLLGHSLRSIRTSSVELLTWTPTIASSSFHSSALLAKDGPRPPKSKPFAGTKRNSHKPKTNVHNSGHSNRRLTQWDTSSKDKTSVARRPIQSNRTRDYSKKKSDGNGWRKSPGQAGPSRWKTKESSYTNSRRPDTRLRGEAPKRNIERKPDFTEGVDDFTNINASTKKTAPPPSRGFSKPQDARRRSVNLEPQKYERDALTHTESSIMATNVEKFSSVPLNINLIESVEQSLGPRAEPTNIQRLSLSHFFKRNPGQPDSAPIAQRELASSMSLLASQTGSGKSIAYLLPMLHSIKWAELKAKDGEEEAQRSVWSPKGLILAPTHELSRQLSRFAKTLCHNIKLRVVCLSQANQGASAARFDDINFAHLPLEGSSAEFELHPDTTMGQSPQSNQRPVDIMVGTTARVLDLARGRQWRNEIEKLMERNPWEKEAKDRGQSMGRSNSPGWKSTLDLSQVDWVVMDEADVVYDPDFIHSTELLLNDIAAAKAKQGVSRPGQGPPDPNSPFPFNLVLCTATVPNHLNHYISTHYPTMEKLTSIRLHNLPKSITPEHVSYSGGNKAANIAARLRSIWAEDAIKGQDSKVLLFCNKSAKVESLAQYLTEHGIPAIPLVRVLEKGTRARNNDKAILPFLKTPASSEKHNKADEAAEESDSTQQEPRVLITTSILSRGLDFNESVRHVFIVDEPRNLVDFIHRAGRTGRAGQKGKVVLFSKSSGRGSARSRTGVRGEIMQKLGLRPTKVVRRPADAFAY